MTQVTTTNSGLIIEDLSIGDGVMIPPNATLTFKLELVEISE